MSTEVKERWQVGMLGLLAGFAMVCVADCVFHRWPQISFTSHAHLQCDPILFQLRNEVYVSSP